MTGPPDFEEISSLMQQKAPLCVSALQGLARWYDAFCLAATAVTAASRNNQCAYHYTKVEALESMVLGSSEPGKMEIRAGNVGSLNDNSEFILGWDVLHQAALRRPGPVPVALDMALCRMLQERACDAYVLSLTKLRDSSNMWRDYGDNHRGVCIGFNLPVVSDSLGLFPINISYDIEAFTRRCLVAFHGLCNCCESYGKSLPPHSLSPMTVSPLRTILSCVALQYKFPDWQHEQEVRFFQWNRSGQEGSPRDRKRNLACHLDATQCVTEIIAGKDCSIAQKARIDECRKLVGLRRARDRGSDATA